MHCPCTHRGDMQPTASHGVSAVVLHPAVPAIPASLSPYSASMLSAQNKWFAASIPPNSPHVGTRCAYDCIVACTDAASAVAAVAAVVPLAAVAFASFPYGAFRRGINSGGNFFTGFTCATDASLSTPFGRLFDEEEAENEDAGEVVQMPRSARLGSLVKLALNGLPSTSSVSFETWSRGGAVVLTTPLARLGGTRFTCSKYCENVNLGVHGTPNPPTPQKNKY